MEIKIIDEGGTWFRCNARFPMPDPSSGHTFYPGTAYKVKGTPWMDKQEVIEAIDDPTAPAPSPVQEELAGDPGEPSGDPEPDKATKKSKKG